MFYKAYGSSGIREELERGISPRRIVAAWSAGVERFEAEREPYLLY